MQALGKGKALRESMGGAWGSDAWGSHPWGGGGSHERVYLCPGMVEGVSKDEITMLTAPSQSLVMDAWFRANFVPGRNTTPVYAAYPELELAKEFGGAVQGNVIELLGKKLAGEAWVWTIEEELDTKIAADHLEILLARVAAVEKALAKLEPQRGGIGHNNPPDGPLSAEEQLEVSSALDDLRNEASAEQPAPSRVERQIAVLAKAAAAIGHWIWKRVEMGVDEAIKKAAGAGGIFTAADAMDAWQKLNGLIETVGRWMSLIGT